MSTKRSKKKQLNRFLGLFTLADGQSAIGELRLKGANTLLKVHSDQVLASATSTTSVEGTAYTGERLTLIDCHSPGSGNTGFKDDPRKYYADIFPHYVSVGRSHLNPNQPYINAIHFATTDLMTLFYDFDAFSHVIDAKPIIDLVLQERRKTRPVESGEQPLIAYFTGKDCIIEVLTTIGKVSAHHRPSYSLGGPTGVFVKNHIVVSVEPVRPVTFSVAIDNMHEVVDFLSVAAGRTQGISQIQITTTESLDERPQSLTIHPSLLRKVRKNDEQHKPHPGDIPLDPIQRPIEFKTVLSNWIDRHSDWRVARARYLGCLRKANKYSVDRLVAAANMFDILPQDAVPLTAELPEDLAATRDACKAMLRKLPAGIDRNSALDALGRLGKPSLPKKVLHRVSIVDSNLGRVFPDLQLVAGVAIKCRNFFVHGSSGDINYQAIESLIPFLTDTLEFIFAASDFIEAGWDAQRWSSEAFGWGHSFTRYRAEYDVALAELKYAIAAT